jgi:hypothetical protein
MNSVDIPANLYNDVCPDGLNLSKEIQSVRPRRKSVVDFLKRNARTVILDAAAIMAIPLGVGLAQNDSTTSTPSTPKPVCYTYDYYMSQPGYHSHFTLEPNTAIICTGEGSNESCREMHSSILSDCLH